jgi:hypothetical protein
MMFPIKSFGLFLVANDKTLGKEKAGFFFVAT